MKNLKEHIKRLKPWIILSTYIIFLLLLIIKFDTLDTTFKSYLNLLKPFFISIGIAYVLNIPMVNIEKYLHRHIKQDSFFYRKIRTISITLTVIFTFLLLALFMSVILPQLIDSIGYIITNIYSLFNGLVNNFNELLEFLKIEIKPIEFTQAGINNFLEQFNLDLDLILKNLTSFITGTTFNIFDFIMNFANQVANWFVGFMLALYLLGSKETFIRQARKVIAAVFKFNFAKKITEELTIVNDIFKNFVGGQLVEAVIIGVLIYIMMIITNMPYAILISCIVSLFALVPVFGAMFAMGIGFILIFSVDPIKAIWFIVLFQTVQFFENNLIYPKVVGESVGLPAIWTLLSIILFGGMYGIIGMLMAVPLTASVYIIASRYLNERLNKQNLIVTTNDIYKKEEDTDLDK